MRWVIVSLFVAAYAAISARRLSLLPVGRPAVAMVGACLVVLVGRWAGPYGLSPDEALAAVEPSTIALLFGMMLLAAGLSRAGFFDRAARAVLGWTTTPLALLYAVTIGAGLLSALLVNDAVCLLAAPFVARLCTETRAPKAPLLLGLAMGANTGSAMTLAGNPQNMLVARLSGLSYSSYLRQAGAASLLALVLTAALLHLMFRRALAAQAAVSVESTLLIAAPDDRGSLNSLLRPSLFAIALVTLANLSGAHLAASALMGASIVIVAARQHASTLLGDVDWSVLVFFAALFVLVTALRRTGIPDEVLAALSRTMPPGNSNSLIALCLALLLGSQLVSNVPLILLLEPWIRTLPDQPLAWTLTALVSTLAGNLTLLGSVANVIVIEAAGAQDEIGFWQYARVGVPVTILTTLAAVGALLALR